MVRRPKWPESAPDRHLERPQSHQSSFVPLTTMAPGPTDVLALSRSNREATACMASHRARRPPACSISRWTGPPVSCLSPAVLLVPCPDSRTAPLRTGRPACCRQGRPQGDHHCLAIWVIHPFANCLPFVFTEMKAVLNSACTTIHRPCGVRPTAWPPAIQLHGLLPAQPSTHARNRCPSGRSPPPACSLQTVATLPLKPMPVPAPTRVPRPPA